MYSCWSVSNDEVFNGGYLISSMPVSNWISSVGTIWLNSLDQTKRLFLLFWRSSRHSSSRRSRPSPRRGQSRRRRRRRNCCNIFNVCNSLEPIQKLFSSNIWITFSHWRLDQSTNQYFLFWAHVRELEPLLKRKKKKKNGASTRINTDRIDAIGFPRNNDPNQGFLTGILDRDPCQGFSPDGDRDSSSYWRGKSR